MTPATPSRAGRGPFVVAGVALAAGLLWMLWPMPAVDPVGPGGGRAHAAAEPADAAGNTATGQREQVAAAKSPDEADEPTEPLWPVRFLVVDDAGAPIEGCNVSAVDSVRTGHDGRASLQLSAERWTITFESGDGRHVTERGHIVVREGMPEMTIVLARVADLSFHGRAVDGITGAPVAGAEVALCERGRRIATVATAADGSFEVRAAGERTWLEVRADGHALRLVQVVAGHEVRESGMRVPLLPVCRLRLRVTDAAGRPLSGIDAGVSAAAADLLLPAGAHLPRAPERWRLATDERGEATIEPLPAMTTLAIELKRHEETLHRRVLELGAGEQELVIALGGAAVRGTVVRSDGGALDGVLVGLARWDDTPPAFMVTVEGMRMFRCGADGAFAFTDLDAGPWLVGIVSGKWGARLVQTCVPIQVEPGGQHQVELHVPVTGVIAGRCLLPDGAAAAEVALELLDDRGRWATGTVSDARGTFSIGPLPPGSWLLRVDTFRDQLGLPSPVPVQTGDRELELRLVPTMGRVTGRVVDSAGRPLRGWVLMNRRDHDDALAMHTALDGTFGFEGLRPGTWDVSANDAGVRAAVAAGLQVQPGRDAGPVTLTMQPGGALVIRGRGELLIRLGDAVLLRDNMPPGGSYRIRVPAGDYSVTLTPDGAAPQTFTATVTASRDAIVGG